jgi:tetratricopeptide (TPR) repeat protein
MLVVLDNAREPDQVRPLMPGSAGCLAVVTSRNELSGLVAADGARPMRLDLLSPDEARELLARRLGPDRLAAEPDAVEEIIVRCGRLPLALAIVAARAVGHPDFPLAELTAEVRQAGLEALSGSDPATDVRAVFGWSYQALSGAAARLFRLLGLHPGPDISAPAAASLAGASLGRVGSWLGELTRAHVITEHSPHRYAFHDLLRAYAAELAHAEDSASDRRAAVRRGVDHYLHTARAGRMVINPAPEPIRLTRPDPGVGVEHLTDYGEAMAWFTAEHAVLLAAVDHAAAHGLHTHTWQLAWALATYLSRRGHWHDYVAIQNRALSSARQGDDRTGQAQAHSLLGSAYTKTERYEEAELHFQKALEASVALGDGHGEAAGHWGLGYTLGLRGRHREALDHDLKSLGIYRTIDDRFALARALNAVGWDHTELGEHERAIEYCEEALALITEIGGGVGQAAILNSLGNCHQRLGDHARAIERFRQALGIYRELGDRYYEADTLADLMGPLVATGDIDAARCAGEDALAILEELGHSGADRVRVRLAGLAARRIMDG